MNQAVIGASTALGLVFLAAGVLKLLDRRPLTRFLRALGFPTKALGFAVPAIGAIELLIAMLLLLFPVGVFGWLTVFAASLIMLITVGLGALRGVNVPCGCFGGADAAGIQTSVIRSASVCAVAATLLIYTFLHGVPSSADVGARFVGLPLGLVWLLAFHLAARDWRKRALNTRWPSEVTEQ
jgi:hypothetical protein